jgi:Zn-dependent protease
MESGEITDITISVLALAFAFSISNLGYFPIVLVTVGIGFVAHELAHRVVANYYGAKAAYRASQNGLLLLLAMAVMTGGRLILAAPGAVYIYSAYLSNRENGIISISGAVVNCILAILFLFVGLAIGMGFGQSSRAVDVASLFISFGTITNLWLALFNMIPIPPFDGSKVFRWNPTIWLIFTGLVFAAWFFLSFILFAG